jgi:hypothetical protein
MHATIPLTTVQMISPLIVAVLFIAACSVLKEPARRNFSAIMIAGAGAGAQQQIAADQGEEDIGGPGGQRRRAGSSRCPWRRRGRRRPSRRAPRRWPRRCR